MKGLTTTMALTIKAVALVLTMCMIGKKHYSFDFCGWLWWFSLFAIEPAKGEKERDENSQVLNQEYDIWKSKIYFIEHNDKTQPIYSKVIFLMAYLPFHDWKSHCQISTDHWPTTRHWQYLINNTFDLLSTETCMPKFFFSATFCSYKQLKPIESKPTIKHANNFTEINFQWLQTAKCISSRTVLIELLLRAKSLYYFMVFKNKVNQYKCLALFSFAGDVQNELISRVV